LHFSWLEKKHAIDSQKSPINSIELLSTWKHMFSCFYICKKHESNELQETTLRISLQRKKETKRSMKQSKKTQKKKRIQKKCATIWMNGGKKKKKSWRFVKQRKEVQPKVTKEIKKNWACKREEQQNETWAKKYARDSCKQNMERNVQQKRVPISKKNL
jgi:hypothetical protein